MGLFYFPCIVVCCRFDFWFSIISIVNERVKFMICAENIIEFSLCFTIARIV
jgi:hypothetical protein